MAPARSNSIPLPAALLALSVAVCIGAAGSAQAQTNPLSRAAQAEQRETIEHLLEAIQLAARKLSDRLTGQAAHVHRVAVRSAFVVTTPSLYSADVALPSVLILREALLNLPPPSC